MGGISYHHVPPAHAPYLRREVPEGGGQRVEYPGGVPPQHHSTTRRKHRISLPISLSPHILRIPIPPSTSTCTRSLRIRTTGRGSGQVGGRSIPPEHRARTRRKDPGAGGQVGRRAAGPYHRGKAQAPGGGPSTHHAPAPVGLRHSISLPPYLHTTTLRISLPPPKDKGTTPPKGSGPRRKDPITSGQEGGHLRGKHPRDWASSPKGLGPCS